MRCPWIITASEFTSWLSCILNYIRFFWGARGSCVFSLHLRSTMEMEEVQVLKQLRYVRLYWAVFQERCCIQQHWSDCEADHYTCLNVRNVHMDACRICVLTLYTSDSTVVLSLTDESCFLMSGFVRNYASCAGMGVVYRSSWNGIHAH